MPRPAAYARKSDRASALGTSIPQQVKGQGFMTSSRATRTTWRSNVEQVWPPCRPLHFTNPSPIIPKHPPHTAHVRMAPSTPADSRSSCAPHADSRLIQWQRVDEQHGPKTSSIFMRAGAKPWAVLAGWPVTFTAGSEDFYSDRFGNFGSQPRPTGPAGGGSGIVTDALLTTLLACWCLYNHYIVWGCGINTLEHTKSFP